MLVNQVELCTFVDRRNRRIRILTFAIVIALGSYCSAAALSQMPFVAGLLIQCGTQNKTETEGQQKLETRKTEEPMLLHKTLMRVSL